MVRRMILWRGLDEWTAEAARVEIGDDGLRATGTQLGAHRLPYRLDYALDATGRAPAGGFVTRHLRVAIAGDGWRRSIDLLRGDDGAWQCGAEAEGEPAVELPAPRLPDGESPLSAPGLPDGESAGGALPAPGLPPAAAAALGPAALDCDLAFSPLTNLMPIRRHRLDREPGERAFTMAWVSVPDLRIHADEQRYEHLAPEQVRFSQPGGFSAELLLDADGLVRRYPGIAERL
ncbi:putative glycolipid-binding domain-containing protein [Conexibacter sp. JD483]|uniref:putative glycolipid-binding domain-containing protein n=1 Tax=unclassified Conexibacter TaxID=2627773 RepID=UPI00271BE4C9|nr:MULTISPECIES: putative glycolipid-binding domain-containing protein [unclassified Conexibacter]MDO8185500.1 putative glycolipid-binding domain-containing protein [Conexibacter sp. CPCC 205706]MDO8197313.1 putative glycolipid-binding domain-containing protein [Conexibacter sp. CPCC 205762]MDR9370187.1 putative glycolipid-binding domain-containing protein [Conexibacter sp. JD483]